MRQNLWAIWLGLVSRPSQRFVDSSTIKGGPKIFRIISRAHELFVKGCTCTSLCQVSSQTQMNEISNEYAKFEEIRPKRGTNRQSHQHLLVPV